MSKPYNIKSITEYHKVMDLQKPEHSLISIIKFEDIKRHQSGPTNITNDFYSIALKKDFNAKLKYGQQEYDFDEGILHFMSPKQVLSFEFRTDCIFRSMLTPLFRSSCPPIPVMLTTP